jgi:hypothetical protein
MAGLVPVTHVGPLPLEPARVALLTAGADRPNGERCAAKRELGGLADSDNLGCECGPFAN